MRLLEYQAKDILKDNGIRVPKSRLITKNRIPDLDLPVVIKSQVPVGGRGKAGGVIVVEETTRVASAITKIFAIPIKDHLPTTLLAEELITIKKELYLALLIDRSAREIQVLAHPTGGIEVEKNTTSDFLRVTLSKDSLPTCAKRLGLLFGYNVSAIETLLRKLRRTFVSSDATLLEINPLILTLDDELVCGDCKMEIDDAALFRHPELADETTPESNFVKLDNKGTVATIANGAGLAMATVDAVADHGMRPANFLDIGGGATTASVLEAFSKIIEFPGVKAIVINIFAGITRCDEIAKAIIEARDAMPELPPLFIRLAGTNFEEAVALLSAHEIPTLSSLEDCLLAAREVIRE